MKKRKMLLVLMSLVFAFAFVGTGCGDGLTNIQRIFQRQFNLIQDGMSSEQVKEILYFDLPDDVRIVGEGSNTTVNGQVTRLKVEYAYYIPFYCPDIDMVVVPIIEIEVFFQNNGVSDKTIEFIFF